jgi:hypothetical protein
MSTSTPPATPPAGELPARIPTWRAEHGRLRDWLARLDGCDSDAPLHVLHAVRRDYAQRLTALREEINAGSCALREAITTATDRAARAVDAIAEARLRHMIGEVDTGAVATRIAAHEAEIAAALEEQKLLQRGLAATEELLGELEQAPMRPQPAPASRAAPPPPPARDPAQMFVEWEAPVAAAPAQPADHEAELDELAFLEQLPASALPPTSPPPNGVVSFATLKDHPRGPRPGNSGTVAPLISSQPVVRCRKCGTSNDPSLWYCEKCGGELA